MIRLAFTMVAVALLATFIFNEYGPHHLAVTGMLAGVASLAGMAGSLLSRKAWERTPKRRTKQTGRTRSARRAKGTSRPRQSPRTAHCGLAQRGLPRGRPGEVRRAKRARRARRGRRLRRAGLAVVVGLAGLSWAGLVLLASSVSGAVTAQWASWGLPDARTLMIIACAVFVLMDVLDALRAKDWSRTRVWAWAEAIQAGGTRTRLNVIQGVTAALVVNEGVVNGDWFPVAYVAAGWVGYLGQLAVGVGYRELSRRPRKRLTAWHRFRIELKLAAQPLVAVLLASMIPYGTVFEPYAADMAAGLFAGLLLSRSIAARLGRRAERRRAARRARRRPDPRGGRTVLRLHAYKTLV